MKKFTKAIQNVKRTLIKEGFETIDSYQNDELADAPELSEIADQTPSQREKTLDWFKDHNASHSLIDGIEELIDLAKDYEDADKKDSDLYDQIVKLARELEDKFHANPSLVKSGIKKFGDIKKGDEEIEDALGEIGSEVEGEESELFGELLGLDLGMLNHFKAFFKQHNASKKFIENFEKFLNKAGEYQKSGKKDKNLYNEIMTIGRELDAEIYSNKSLLKSIIKKIGGAALADSAGEESDEITESVEDGVSYSVVLIGGSIGEKRVYSVRELKGLKADADRVTDDLAKAKEDASFLNKGLSKGEKSYYGLKYVVAKVKDGKYV